MKKSRSLFASAAAAMAPAPKPVVKSLAPAYTVEEVAPESPSAALFAVSDTLACIMVLEGSFPGPVLAPIPLSYAKLPRSSTEVPEPATIKPAPFPVVLISQLCVLMSAHRPCAPISSVLVVPLWHRYAMLPSRTAVDREVNALVRDGTLRLFKFPSDDNQHLVARTQHHSDYVCPLFRSTCGCIDGCHGRMGVLVQIAGLIASDVDNAPVYSLFQAYLKCTPPTDVSHCVRLVAFIEEQRRDELNAADGRESASVGKATNKKRSRAPLLPSTDDCLRYVLRS